MKLRRYSSKDIKPGVRVLMRVDFNVPLKRRGLPSRTIDSRISAVVPEVQALQKRGAKIILISHLGRPDGKYDKSLSTRPVARIFSRAVGQDVKFIDSYLEDGGRAEIESLEHGEIAMLENVRFHPEEEKNQAAFAKRLAQFGDIFVNNAFGTCHRKHASVAAITKYLPSFAGDLLELEVKSLSQKLKSPFILVIGGVKLKTKIDILLSMAPKAQAILVGGGVADSLLSVKMKKKFRLGSRELEASELDLAKKVLEKVESKIVLPMDVMVACGAKTSRVKQKYIKDLSSTDRVFDIGPETVELFRRVLVGANSVVWNGPVGYIEKRSGRKGTLGIAKAISCADAHTIVGGGDTVAFLEQEKLLKNIDFVSSGGGAMLVFLAGKPMPGLNALKK